MELYIELTTQMWSELEENKELYLPEPNPFIPNDFTLKDSSKVERSRLDADLARRLNFHVSSKKRKHTEFGIFWTHPLVNLEYSLQDFYLMP